MQNLCSLLPSIHQFDVYSLSKAVILVIAGLLLAPVTSKASQKLISRYSSAQTMLFQKIIYFLVLSLFLVSALQQLGFKLSVLLGSAGIITAAIAIASQTSISNIISGLFLIFEKSLQIGDQIKVGSNIGTITSIDLLSVKILTSQNTLIRIPNDSLIKTEITNLTRFETRRTDLSLKIALEEDVKKVKDLLLNIAKNHAVVLKTPLPSVSIQEIDSSGIYLTLSIWTDQKNHDLVADSLYEEILTIFQENNIQF